MGIKVEGVGGPGSDTTALHTDTSGEIAALSILVAADGDSLIAEDLSESNNKKKLLLSAMYTYLATKLELDKYGITIGTSDPTVNDDSAAGFSVGNLMVNTATPSFWRCSDVTVGAAVWTDISSGGGWVGTATSDLDMNGNDITLDAGTYIKNEGGGRILSPVNNGWDSGYITIQPASGGAIQQAPQIASSTAFLSLNDTVVIGTATSGKNLHMVNSRGIKTASTDSGFNDKFWLRFLHTDNAVNYFDIKNEATGNAPYIAAQSTLDANVPVEIRPKGTSYTDIKAGGIVVNRTATATSVSSSLADTIIGVTDTSSAWTITLDSDTVVEGHVTIIKDESGAAGTNNITIATEGAETIDGAATATISANHGVIRLYSDGTNFFTI
jgi:hypothetical protein